MLKRRLARRFGWGVADQALSSLTNFALGVAIARSVSAVDFGAYAIAFSVYLIALNVTRHLSVQPVAIRYAGGDVPAWRSAAGAATGLVLVLSISMGLVLLVGGLIAGGALGASLVALGVTLPGLLLQDAWRLTFFAGNRGINAFVTDAVWTLLLFPGFLLLGMAGLGGSLFAIMMLWGLSGCVAALTGIVQARVLPDPSRAIAWWREHRDIGPQFLMSELASMLSREGVTFVLGLVSGLAAAGSLRAAQLLLGPINILTMGVYFVAVPAGARLYAEHPQRLRTTARFVSVAVTTATVALSVVILAVPEVVGPFLLGESWPGAALVFLPVALTYLARGVGFGPRIGLVAMAKARRTLNLTIVEAGFALAAGTAGAVVAAASGTAWGSPSWRRSWRSRGGARSRTGSASRPRSCPRTTRRRPRLPPSAEPPRRRQGVVFESIHRRTVRARTNTFVRC